MTATIAPLAGIPSLARTDPAVRLADYRSSLSFYCRLLGTSFDQLLFVENSASDLSPLIKDADEKGVRDKIEFISFYGLDYNPAYGRGYGEFRLIDHAIATSRALRPDDIVWKVTGRYIVRNIDKLVSSRPADADIYCHMRNYPYRLCELYLLAWTRRGYENVIRGVYPRLRNDIVPGAHTIEETLFREILERAAGQVRLVPRLRSVPVVEGTRGWDNSRYSNAWSAKVALRRVANLIVPSFWI
jgi:hypothetical protein